jgi:chemotaxis protein methyltransferase CheR
MVLANEFENTKLNDQDFNKITELIYENFGIHIPENKRAMLNARISSLIRKTGYPNSEMFIDDLFKSKNEEIILLLADSISTNHTFFFREKEHFKVLHESIMNRSFLKNKNDNKLRIWSAGCSSGQESYTISMIVDNLLYGHYDKIDTKILATDISITALSKAMKGIYNEKELDKVPRDYFDKYFKNIGANEYIIKDRLREYVSYKWFNLMTDTYPFRGKFDYVFCRNVMIYFDKQAIEKIINRIYCYMTKGGILFIGQTETLPKELKEKFQFYAPGVFIKK